MQRSGRGASRFARPRGWLQWALSHADAAARTAALFVTLEADAKKGSPQARLLQTLPACARAQARWRQHGSRHGQARQSSQLLRAASAHAYASGKISSQGRTETMGVSVADQ